VNLTPEELTKLECLCGKLPAGLWQILESTESVAGEVWPCARVIAPMGDDNPGVWVDLVPYSTRIAEMRFIAAARTAVPKLLADREELVKQLSEALSTHKDRITDAVTSDYAVALRTRAEKAEAERDRLREALEQAVDRWCPIKRTSAGFISSCHECGLADKCDPRTALNPKEATNA